MKPDYAAGVRHNFEPQQVIAIIGDVNYSYVYLNNGSCQLHSRTLKWFHDKWPEFLRIHKNALINVSHIQNYYLKGGRQPIGYVIMKNNLRLDVSRRNVKPVALLLSQMSSGKISQA